MTIWREYQSDSEYARSRDLDPSCLSKVISAYIPSPLPDHNVVSAVILRILRSKPLSALLPNLPLVPPRNLTMSFKTKEDTRTNLKPMISSYIT
jgi:hypothetical protein